MKIKILDTAYELSFLISETSLHFSKPFKFSYGDRLQQLSLDLLFQIIHTNNLNNSEKSIEISKITEIIQKINILCQ